MNTHIRFHRFLGAFAALVTFGAIIGNAQAASSWNPTLLVNTESFQRIDRGDGTTSVDLEFGSATQTIKFLTTNRFQFSHAISVLGTISGSSLNVDRNATVGGTLTVTGAVTGMGDITAKGNLSGSNLTVTRSASIFGALLVKGNIATRATVSGANLTFMGGTSYILGSLGIGLTSPKTKFSVLGTISGSTLNVDRNATVGGSLTVTGAILSKSNITAKGALSGSTLTVDGNVTIHGLTYVFPSGTHAVGFLKNDGAGNLTWSSTSVGNGSGELLSLHPEYPNAIYFSSGASFIGQLSASGGVAGINENYYHWTSTKSALNDYWISVRVRLPDNFSSWDPVKPIELRYRTGSGQSLAQGQGSYITVRMKDTANAFVALTGAGNLANTSFTTANITGPQAGGGQTWAPKGYITVYIKLAASTTPNGNWFAEAGFLNLNFETTTP